MKKNIGTALALYPTPLVIVGTMVNGKPNYTLVGHIGIIGHDRIMVSMSAAHYSNIGIKQSHVLTVNVVDAALLEKADYVGCVSGHDTDKSQAFDYHVGATGAPMIDSSPVTIECEVEDIYQTPGFESFICNIHAVHAEESILTQTGKIDYRALKPVLFEFPTYEYLLTGDVIGKCKQLGKEHA